MPSTFPTESCMTQIRVTLMNRRITRKSWRCCQTGRRRSTKLCLIWRGCWGISPLARTSPTSRSVLWTISMVTGNCLQHSRKLSTWPILGSWRNRSLLPDCFALELCGEPLALDHLTPPRGLSPFKGVRQTRAISLPRRCRGRGSRSQAPPQFHATIVGSHSSRPASMPTHLQETRRRRTFAIVSHPDAGKTTLTEKLLLFGGAIQMAGSVKSRKTSRSATSDWMALEKERGISVTSSVMQFPYEGKIVNLLDTPGHADFSEDTYRVLTAVDSALMVIDCAKGVEERTIKLMEVCRLRDTPIMTFINKLDREGRSPIELLDEVESVLGIATAPVTWPIGMGRELRGIYHLLLDEVHLFEQGKNFTRQDSTIFKGLDAPGLEAAIGNEALAEL